MELKLDLEEIGKRLEKIRREKGYTQSQLAEMFGCQRESISYYENGKQLLNTERLLDYMQVFEVSADYILTGKKPQNLENFIREIKSVCDKYECNK